MHRITRLTDPEDLLRVDARLWPGVGGLEPGEDMAYWAVDGEPRLGFSVAHVAADGVLVLDRAWVCPALRSSGLGRRLTRARLAWGRRQGCTKARTYTWNGNVKSARNLIRCGFLPVKRSWDGSSGWLHWELDLARGA